MQRPRRRDRIELPLFDQPGSPTAPAPVLDLDETYRLTCIRYGVVPTGAGLPGPPWRDPRLRCGWPGRCAWVLDCACPLTTELRAQLHEESRP